MRIVNDFLEIEDSDFIKVKKITATNITALLGTNKFKKKGDAVLGIMGLYRETIDPFYTQRGEIAELVLREKYKQDGYEIKWWDKYEISFDNFPKNKDFGGMIDMALISPTRELVECKSKNIKDFEKTVRFKNDDYEHQAIHYGYLSKCENVNLHYVFFTDEQEQKIRNKEKLDITPCEFKYYTYKIAYDRAEYEEKLEKCKVYRDKCVSDRKIPICDISDKVLQNLRLLK